MKRYIGAIFLAVLMTACAGTETRNNEDHSARNYDIQAQNNTGTINLWLTKEETREASAKSEGGEASPNFDLAAAIAEGGSTTSLATEGAKLALENVSSLMEYLEGRWENDPPVIDPEQPEQPIEPPTGGLYTEVLWYRGRTNPDRPTWYGEKDFKDYPQKFVVTVEGCTQFSVNEHNGERLTHGTSLLKQSDVPGRGLALLVEASCQSTEATISYLK